MPLIENAHRRNQFAAEEDATAAVKSECRQRGNNGVIAHRLAEVTLDAPERHDEPRLYIEPLTHLLQQRQVLGGLRARRVEALLSYHLVEKLGKAQPALGLFPVQLDHARQIFS